MVAGFLPERFREELGLSWGPRRERWHMQLARLAIAGNRVLPGALRRFPINAYLIDTRRRIRRGQAIV
jgi:uncharacterized protein (DUF2236 family)